MISKSRLRILNIIMLLIIFLLQIVDNIEKSGYSLFGINLIKNSILLISCLFYLWQVYLNHKNNKIMIFKYELKNILYMAILISLISLFYIVKNEMFTMNTVIGIVKIVLPVVVAYSVLNTLDIKEIYYCMVIFLIICFIGYISILGISNITIENFLSISFLDSYSPFESNFFSPQAIAFCLFFLYYRHNKLWTILSILFTIMTYKRIMVIFAIFLFIIVLFIKVDKKVNNIWINILKIVFVVGTIGYISVLQGWLQNIIELFFGIDINRLTMGRAWFLDRLLSSGFNSYGFESSKAFTGRDIEMDLVKFYFEISIIGVIVIINSIANLAKSNLYNYIVITFVLIEMLTSHFYDITYFWIVMYITIGCTAYKVENNTINANVIQKKSRKVIISFGKKKLWESE